jgi:hypothetical protein
MTDIYDAHRKAFAKTAAYVIVHEGERVATIAFKFPSDGAGRLWAYVHWTGLKMVRGYAGGFGYDKRSAACANAARNTGQNWGPSGKWMFAFWQALARDGGQTWDSALREAGFDVWQAV